MAELSTLGAVIKTAYEAQADTNAFTDAEKTKLAGLPPVGYLVPLYSDAANETVTDAGPITVAANVTMVDMTNAINVSFLSLGNGTQVGQMKHIVRIGVNSEQLYIEPNSFADGSLILLAYALAQGNEPISPTWTGIWNGTAWRTVALGGYTVIS